jgi:oligogalacturonide lyase
MKKPITIVFTAIISFNLQAQSLLETGGQKMPDEWIDNATHHKVIKLTRREGSNGSFYFHNNPFILQTKKEGDRMLFYGSNKAVQNAYTVNLKTLAIDQITFSKGRVSSEIIGHKYNNLYYQIKDSVFVTNIDTKATKLIFVFPENYKGGIATINADETFLGGAKASDEQKEISKKYPEKKDFFDKIFDAHLPNDLFTINIKTGELKVIHTENTWIGHVQFSPTNPEILMFCHEGPWHKVDRIWHININTKEVKLMHKRTMDMEIAGHEWFAPDGKTIWYDLQQPRAVNFFVAGTDVKTGEETKYKLTRDEWSIHFNISNDLKHFCGDGGNDTQVAKAKDGMWIYYFTPQADSLQAERLVNMKNHQYHLEPNVHFSPDGKWVIFRANFEGEENVYAVEVKRFN